MESVLFNIGCFEVTLSLFVVLLLLLWMRSRRPSDYPPGPTPIPIIGNFHNLFKADFLGAFRDLRKRYGDIYSLSLGKFWIIAVNGEDNLRELLVKKGEVTSDRPPFFVLEVARNKGIASSSGTVWKHQRTFALSKLRSFGFGKRSFESSIQEEIGAFLQLLESYNGQSFKMTGILNTSMANNIMSISVGRRFEYDDHKLKYFIQLMNENINNAAFAGPLNFMPVLAKLPGDLFGAKKILKNAEEIFEFIQEEVDDHKKTLDENNIRDFTDCYLIEMKENKESNVYTEEQLLSVIADLFIAGTETTSTTIRWALLYLMHNMNVQKKMWTEIDDVVGLGRLPSLEDRPNLPYCEAVILESLRVGNITPLSLPHNVSEDIFYKGYRIPKDSVLLPLLESVSFDEDLFPDSHTFKPERFIDGSGKIFGQDKILSFSLGRRVCLGESLARMELFLYLTALIQRFEFLPPEGENPPPTKGHLGVVYSPVDYKLRAMSRQ